MSWICHPYRCSPGWKDCAVPISGSYQSYHQKNAAAIPITRKTCLIRVCIKRRVDHRENASCSEGVITAAVFPQTSPEEGGGDPASFYALAVPTSSRLRVTLNSSPVALGDSRSHWSSAHCSPHLRLSACKHEVMRSPVERSSDGVRAEKGVKSGLHIWEVVWSPGHRGSHAVLGVSRHSCPLQASEYKVLVGGDSQSWGWELKTNRLWHSGQRLGSYPAKKAEAPEGRRSFTPPEETPLPIPERVLLVLDADAGTLGFVVEGSFLGVAFKNLPSGVELFPAVSSVRGGARIRLRYLNGATRDPPALMALCGLSIRQFLGHQRQNETDKLPLPPVLQCYLLSSQ